MDKQFARSNIKRLEVRLTVYEHSLLFQKAAAVNQTVSQYVRNTLIHSDNLTINQIDTSSLDKTYLELTRQGNNLNQLMKFLNTYGKDVYASGTVNKVLREQSQVLLSVQDALISLRREAERYNVHINIDKTKKSLERMEGTTHDDNQTKGSN